MTDHIVSFSIGIDDDAIKQTIQERANKEIINQIKKDILNDIFGTGYYNSSAAKLNPNSGNIELNSGCHLKDSYKELIINTIKEYKDEIIDKAAHELAESFKHTKAWKERANEKIK